MMLQSFLTADNADMIKAQDRLKHAKMLAEAHIKLYEKGLLPPDVKLPDELDAAGRAAVIADLLLDARLVLGDALLMGAVLKVTTGSKLKGVL
jgi:hypothetical protein